MATAMTTRRPCYPLIAPRPPRASRLADVFSRIEASGTYSNHGPEVRAFERAVTAGMFAGRGASVALANATLGLMLAMREAAERAGRPAGYALMPALTFAATGEAALWAGLTPLICDIDADDWGAAPAAEDALLEAHGAGIAVVVPYATFGNAIDLARYDRLARRHGVGVVVDAAASLGTLDDAGIGFGAGYPHAVVFSMQATKPFAVAEGAVVHSGDTALIDRLRAMSNFGFEAPRSASLPGLNAKLPEVLAAIASAKLDEIEDVSERRAALEASYREALGGFGLQRVAGRRRALGFMPVLLPPPLARRRAAIIEALAARGIGAGHYFSPHLAQQPLFQQRAVATATPVADDIAARILSLPATDDMTPADARAVAAALRESCGLRGARPHRAPIAETLIVGGGPAGVALLIAADKAGRLDDLAAGGLIVAERGDRIGAGRLARYAIASDSSAQTFLTAIEARPELADHPAAHAIAEWTDKLGVPLTATGPFLDAIGDRIGLAVERGGGQVLTGHAVTGARRAGGLWHVTMRDGESGQTVETAVRNLVIATGGHQPLDRLAEQRVAGESLASRAGDRLLQSDEVLLLGGLDRVADLLAGKRDPRVVVIGGSTSALTSVALLLRSRPGIPFGAGGITLLHRRPLRPFYPSIEAAYADGFTDFGPDDICPLSGFVYRLAGFRLEARELVLRMLGVGGRVPDPRVAVHPLNDDNAAALAMIDRADLVIAALGYRPRALPLAGSDGAPIALATDTGAPMVDGQCRVIDAAGAPLPGLYGIGLAAGFVPSGALGGEISFRGQANGLWLWQNDVGRLIVDAILNSRAQAAA